MLAATLLIPKNFFRSVKCTIRFVICSSKDISRKITTKTNQLQQIADNISRSETVESEIQLENPDTIQQLEYSHNNNSDAALFPGLLKILIGFYQTVILFKIYNVGKSSGFIRIQEIIATLFNLRTDDLFFQNFSWCPFDNITAVPKLLFKASFTLYLLIILLILFLIFNMLKRLQNRDSDCPSNSLSSRFYCCTLRILLISYATITVSCFTLLSCVDLGPYGKVLYIDGSIQCYTWWQFIVIAIVCLWIACYPIAIYTASWLLRSKIISTKWFLLSLLLPFGNILYWAYVIVKHQRGSESRGEVREDNNSDENSNDILDVLEGPFRKQGGNDDLSDNLRLSWESVFLARRFVLILMKTFIIDALKRLFLMLIINILFLMHHVYVLPFSSTILNIIEAITLVMLIIVCTLNILPAYVYMSSVSISSQTEAFLSLFRNIETVLMLVFPFIIGCCVFFLILVRIIQIIVCIFKNCVRIIRFCSHKRKTL